MQLTQGLHAALGHSSPGQSVLPVSTCLIGLHAALGHSSPGPGPDGSGAVAPSVFMPPWGIPLRDCSIVETAAKTAASSCRLGAFLSGTQHPTLPTGNRKGLHAALGHSSPGQEETQTGDRAGSVFMPPWGIPLRDHRDVSGPGEGPGVFMPPWGIPLRDFHRVVESLLAPPVFMPPWGIPLRDPVQARTEGKSHVFMPPWGIPLRDPTAEIIAGLAVSSCRLGAFLSGTLALESLACQGLQEPCRRVRRKVGF